MIHEPIIGEFTGRLITFIGKEGKRITLKKPISIKKGQGYMLEINELTLEGRVIPVVTP